MSPEVILALSSLITALLAGLGAWRSSKIANDAAKRAARRDEVALLREEVVRLHTRVENLEEENELLRSENELLRRKVFWLESVLFQHGIRVPEMPTGWTRED